MVNLVFCLSKSNMAGSHIFQLQSYMDFKQNSLLAAFFLDDDDVSQ